VQSWREVSGSSNNERHVAADDRHHERAFETPVDAPTTHPVYSAAREIRGTL
jgi:hypothetical protein